jgi:hypothetical protein
MQKRDGKSPTKLAGRGLNPKQFDHEHDDNRPSQCCRQANRSPNPTNRPTDPHATRRPRLTAAGSDQGGREGGGGREGAERCAYPVLAAARLGGDRHVGARSSGAGRRPVGRGARPGRGVGAHGVAHCLEADLRMGLRLEGRERRGEGSGQCGGRRDWGWRGSAEEQ